MEREDTTYTRGAAKAKGWVPISGELPERGDIQESRVIYNIQPPTFDTERLKKNTVALLGRASKS